jgi:hypothetical protein
MNHFTRIATTLGLFLMASSAIACAGLQGTHECGGDLEINPPAFEDCILIEAPGAQNSKIAFYLPPGNRVWVCSVDPDSESKEVAK